MLGAIIGDIVGSRFEFDNIKTKKFNLLSPACFPTDDSILTLAIAKSLLESAEDRHGLSDRTIENIRNTARRYPHAGYGLRFNSWLVSDNPEPYNSLGNGAAMRVSPCGIVAENLEETISLSHAVTCITHNHPEGLKGAEATAVAVYLAKRGESIENIRTHINRHYYRTDFTLDGIRNTYTFNATCAGTVPQAMEAFFESTCFEDAIRNAISIGGDSDTLAAITGGIAGAYYGIPRRLAERTIPYLDTFQQKILTEFETIYPHKTE